MEARDAVAVAILLLCATCNIAERRVQPRHWYKDIAGNWHKTQSESPEQSGKSTTSPPNDARLIAPTHFNNGDTVTVSWSGVSNPDQSDWIGLYWSPFSPSPSLAWSYVSRSPSWQSGYGSLTFRLLNIRRNYVFRYWAKNDSRVLIAESNAVAPQNVNEPLHAHISLAASNDPSQIRVMWVTNSSARAPTVIYGQSANSLGQIAQGTTKTYTADSMCGPGAARPGWGGFIDPGQIHDVLLTNLQPATQYFYQYGNDVEGWSNVRNFTTPRPIGSTKPFKFIAYGDMGEESSPGAVGTARRTLERIANDGVELLLHIGDISYALGNAIMWESWFDLIEPIGAHIPYMITIGNHEYDHTSGGDKDPSHAPGTGFHPSWGNYGDDSNGECGVPMFNRFHMPDDQEQAGSLSPFWYSFNWGNAHFVMISTEHDYTPGSPQYLWLEQDLAKVDRRLTPWVILNGHRPMYCSEAYQGDFNVTLGMQRAFEDLIYQWKVDLALWGHYHSYERTCPVYKNACQDGAPIHVVIGMAGADLDAETYYPVPWSVFHDQAFGLSEVPIAW